MQSDAGKCSKPNLNKLCNNYRPQGGVRKGAGGISDGERWRSCEIKLDIRKQGLPITIFAISFPTISSQTLTPSR